ncbi:hypothetical protein R1sor_007104 [Riccia sorocarpa]|uniref:RING-type domain-containing protein n=1 Tax=Riccia sorocarpa TaxID=122646 RepID=A0ABD3HPG4_9MARC
MGENLVEFGGASEPAYDREVEKGQIIPEALPTTSEATTVEVQIGDIPVAAVQAPPSSVAAEITMGESLVVHGVVKGSTPTKIQDVEQEVPTPGTAANLAKVVLDVSDYLPIVSSDVMQNARESSGISNDREMLKVLNNFCEAVPLEQDLRTSPPPVERDTPESSTLVPDPTVPSGPQSEADLEAIGRGNVVESVAAAKDDTERGLPMNVAIGVRLTNVREISAADRHAARVELWKRKTAFRGSLLYPKEPKLRYDERIPRKPRRKRTSRAGSTPEGYETSPGTKKPTKRKLNLNPPKNRSPAPEAPRSIQPERKEKRKVDEEATVNIERKGKRKADEQPSPEPTKKKERSDDSNEDSNESIREQGETHRMPLKEKIEILQAQNENLNEIIEETSRTALEQEEIYKLVNKREINLATLVTTKFKEVRLKGHSESIANCDELNFLVTRNEKPVYPTDYDDFLEARKLRLNGSQWEKYACVIRHDLEVKCQVCQDYIGLLPHMCPGTCACKYHIGCFWPAASRRSVCTVCKVPFASKTYEFFNTSHIPSTSKGSINLDTGELELDADQALDSEIHADVMAGRRDFFGPNNVDRARQSEDEKLWRHLVHKFLQIWHHGNGDVKFHTRYMKMEDMTLRSALKHTHNRLVQELEDEGRNNGLDEYYIERMVSVFNDHINKTGDKNVKPMVYLRDWDENADAAGPSYAPMEISSEHDDEENDETYQPTAKSKASGSRKRVAHKPPKRGLMKPGNN